ncbi:hypothetical protein PI126_g5048 [Phytophthora idaei]|nr:hypothetical protein PI126_g5048 [Phytophthora idaei]
MFKQGLALKTAKVVAGSSSHLGICGAEERRNGGDARDPKREDCIRRALDASARGDRIRLVQEHRAFIRGERPTDTDFSSARPTSSGPLRNQARPRPIAKQSAEVEELDDDEEEEDESWDAEDELESATGKAKAKAKRVVKSKKVVKSATGAKPRKKSAATLAKEARVAAAAAKRRAAAKARQDQASDAQKKGKEVKKEARKRLEEAKGKKRMADTEAPAEPKKRRTFPHEMTQGGCDSSTESSTPEPAQTTPGASIVQPLVGPVPAADEGSGDALDSECGEEEEEMMIDYVSASEDTTPPPGKHRIRRFTRRESSSCCRR